MKKLEIKNRHLRFVCLFLIAILFYNCDEDDDNKTKEPEICSPSEGVSVENTDVKTFQVAFINISNLGDLEDTYDAKLGDLAVELRKIDDQTLGLLIPNMESGEYILNFSLGCIDLVISKTKLKQSAEATILSLKKILEQNFIPNDSSYTSEGVTILNAIIENASDEEKLSMVLFYEANKEIFDKMIAIDSEQQSNLATAKKLSKTYMVPNSNQLGIPERLNYLSKTFVLKMIIIWAGIRLVAFPPNPSSAIIGVAAIIGFLPSLLRDEEKILNIAYDIGDSAIEEINESSSLSQKNNKTSKINSSVISFENKQSKSFALTQTAKTLYKAHRSSDNEIIRRIFSGLDDLADLTDKLNKIINFVNKVPFINISLIPKPSIPDTPTAKILNVSNDAFNNYQFSVGHQNISVNAVLRQEGKVDLTLTADESLDLTQAISTTLTINYEDDFSTFTKSYPVKITAIPKIIELSGDMAFGDIIVGETATKTFTISNTGEAALTISDISYPDGYTGNWNTGTIMAGYLGEVTVTFSPTAEQEYNGTITVTSDKTSGTNTLDISGAGTSTNSININSTPEGASIYLDGTRLGEVTPTTIYDILPGEHHIRVYKENYNEYNEYVTINSFENIVVYANLGNPNPPLPVFTIHTPTNNQIYSSNIITVSGLIELEDPNGVKTDFTGNSAILILNGIENEILVQNGVFNTRIALISGNNNISLRANSSNGDTGVSDEIIVVGDFAAKDIEVTLTWNKPTSDLDLHIWNPAGEHSYYRNKRISDGFLDVDDTEGFGPEVFSSTNAQEGMYVVKVNSFSLDNDAFADATVIIKSNNNNNIFGPHRFTIDGPGAWWDVNIITFRITNSGIIRKANASQIPNWLKNKIINDMNTLPPKN